MEGLETNRDVVTAVLIVSTVLLGIAPVFLGIMGGLKKENNKILRWAYLALFISFFIGIMSILMILEWLSSQTEKSLTKMWFYFYIQIVAFGGGASTIFLHQLWESFGGNKEIVPITGEHKGIPSRLKYLLATMCVLLVILGVGVGIALHEIPTSILISVMMGFLIPILIVHQYRKS